jgi:hypothetical protein
VSARILPTVVAMVMMLGVMLAVVMRVSMALAAALIAVAVMWVACAIDEGSAKYAMLLGARWRQVDQ